MSDHGEHFVPSAGGPIWVPEPTCPTCMGDQVVAPVDWPARFRTAAEVAAKEHHERAYGHLRRVASWLEHASPDMVEAVGRALLGEVR